MFIVSFAVHVALTTENISELQLNLSSRKHKKSSTAPGDYYFRNLHSSGFETLVVEDRVLRPPASAILGGHCLVEVLGIAAG